MRDKPLSNKNLRKKAIHEYSHRFKIEIEKVWKTFQDHDPRLRLLVKYENLRNDTFTELKKIYKFLDIPIKDENLKRKIEHFDFDNIPDSKKDSGKFSRRMEKKFQ